MILQYFTFIILATNCCCAIDDTIIPKASGKRTAQWVCRQIEDSFVFPEIADDGFLLRVAAIESDYGTDLLTYRPNFYGGIWQVREQNYNMTKDMTNLEIIKKLNNKFGINWLTTTWMDLQKPLYSGIAFCIILYNYGVPIPNTIKGQAGLWKNLYNPNSTLSVEAFVEAIVQKEMKPVCRLHSNIVLILDGSGSVGHVEFQKAKVAISNLTKGIYSDNTGLGFVLFSSTSESIINLNINFSTKKIHELILNAYYPAGATRTNLAIDMAVSQLLSADNSTARIIVTFTDGFPELTMTSATQATQAGMILFSVGIGSSIVNDNELDILAGQKPGHRLAIDNFDALPELIYRIGFQVCNTEATPRDGETFRDTLSREESRYFKYNLPEDGLTIERKDISGRTIGWFSYSFSNPYDGLNDGPLAGKGKTFIPKNNSTDVHITIQGIRKENNYTMVSTSGNTRRAPIAIANPTNKMLQPCAGFTEIECRIACEKEAWIYGTCSLFLCICDE